MKKINITNLKNGRTFQAKFETQEELDAWKQERITLESWGKAEREIVALSESYEEADVIASRTEEVNGIVIDYVTLKAEYVIETEDITEAYNLEQEIMQKQIDGEKMAKACQAVLAYVTGYNNARAFTLEQVSAFQATFGNVLTCIIANRPNTVRQLITATLVDGSIVTQQLKDGCLYILTKHGF